MAVLTATSRGSSATTTGATWTSATNAYDGAYGSVPATYASFAAASGVTGTIKISGYGFTTSSIPSNTVINFVNVNLRSYVTTANRWSNIIVQAYLGATAIGNSASAALTTTAATYSLNLTGITSAQLVDSTFSIQMTYARAGGSSDTAYIDFADVSVDYGFESWGSLYL